MQINHFENPKRSQNSTRTKQEVETTLIKPFQQFNSTKNGGSIPVGFNCPQDPRSSMKFDLRLKRKMEFSESCKKNRKKMQQSEKGSKNGIFDKNFSGIIEKIRPEIVRILETRLTELEINLMNEVKKTISKLLMKCSGIERIFDPELVSFEFLADKFANRLNLLESQISMVKEYCLDKSFFLPKELPTSASGRHSEGPKRRKRRASTCLESEPNTYGMVSLTEDPGGDGSEIVQIRDFIGSSSGDVTQFNKKTGNASFLNGVFPAGIVSLKTPGSGARGSGYLDQIGKRKTNRAVQTRKKKLSRHKRKRSADIEVLGGDRKLKRGKTRQKASKRVRQRK